MHTQIRALIFDLDGLIVDTETPDYLSWKELYLQHGLSLPVEEWATVVGRHDVDLYAPLRAMGVDLLGAHEARHRLEWTLMEQYLRPLPGFDDLIRRVIDAGIPRGLASNGTGRHVKSVVAGLRIGGLFDAMVSRDDVAAGKPAPDVYLLALSRLGAPPERSIALEDSQTGIRAAKAAGLACVAVPNAFTRHQDLSEADLIADSLVQINLGVLEVLLGTHGQASR